MEALSVDVEGIMDGTVADIPLRKNDILFIPSSLDMKGERTLTIDGEVNFPGVYQYADNTTIEDASGRGIDGSGFHGKSRCVPPN